MKFSITADGHAATVDLTLDGKGHFTLVIDSDDFGTGSGGGVVTGDTLVGSVNLEGHNAKLAATLTDGGIVGALDPGWFFPTVTFSGKQVAA